MIVSVLIVPLVALVALWVFAATVTVGDSLRLLKASTFDRTVVRPTEALIDALQNERRMSLAFLSRDTTIGRVGFDAQRALTDQARAGFIKASRSGDLNGATTLRTRTRMRELAGRLSVLDQIRQLVNDKRIDQDAALIRLSDLIEDAGAIYDTAYSADPSIAQDTSTLIGLQRAREMISREDALLTGALALGFLTPDQQDDFVRLVGAHRSRYAELARALPPADRVRLDALLGGGVYTGFEDYEDRLTHVRSSPIVPPFDSGAWHTATENVLNELVDFEDRTRAGISQRASEHATWVLVRLGLAGGVGLLAVIASSVIGLRMGRRLVRENRVMVDALDTFAQDRLPMIAEMARRGEEIDPDFGAPILDFNVREVQQVYRSFAATREAVIASAVSEAAARRGLNEVFVNLARRNQVLLQRLLRLLDAMERKASGPDELEGLFAIDHLATRMRRHAEGLVILAGRTAGRTWRTPVPIVDTVRAAVAEVEDYQRVKVLPMPAVAISGAAAADIVHLLAELLENATMFSPPGLPVNVTAELVAHGLVIEIEDRGLGLEKDVLTMINERLAEAPDFDLFDSARLGLFVVARLARRNETKVMLRPSPYGGTSAVVLVPSALVTAVEEAPAPAPRVEKPRRAPLRVPAEPVEKAAPVPADDVPQRQIVTGDLPQRKRSGSLVPQLRGKEAKKLEARPAPDPELARSLMSAMQQGWQRGRIVAAAEQNEPEQGSET
jgi:signal transduction histidine kinase